MWQRPACTIKKKLCILPNIVKYVLNATYIGTRNENHENLHMKARLMVFRFRASRSSYPYT